MTTTKTKIALLMAVPLCFSLACRAPKATSIPTNSSNSPTTTYHQTKAWKLIFEDDFKGKSFDTTKWGYSPRWHPAWAKFLTASTDYVWQSQGNLNLRLDNKVIPADPLPYHSGGIQTTQKFNFKYGKVEVRAKFNQGKGSWPAIWMMPETPHQYGDWPKSGEIDIMEHVNKEAGIHHTLHSADATLEDGASKATASVAYNKDDFNTYGLIWEADKMEFYVNNVLTYTYRKAAGATSTQWPFDQPFYLILNQAGGAGWPGAINDADLPFEMQVDYVRVYQLKK